MSDQRINLARVKAKFAWRDPSPQPGVWVSITADERDALVEAVEAAHAYDHERLKDEAAYTPAEQRLDAALAKFDFGPRP